MNLSPLASIIITNYNKSKYCLSALNSCLKQSHKNIEIIFFDDKSTDDSLNKVYKFKKKFKIKNLRIINNKKKIKTCVVYNHIEAVKKSLNKCKGKYIFFLDSDDYFQENKVKEIINYFKINPSKKILFDRPIYLINNKKYKKLSKYYKRNNKWPKFPPTSCMSFEKMKLKKIIKKIDIKKFPNLAIDFRLAVYYAMIENQFNTVNQYLTNYRQVHGSMDYKYKKFKSKDWWTRRLEAFEFMYQLKKNNNTKKFSLDYNFTKAINFIYSII